MSRDEQPVPPPSAEDELDVDRRVERRLLWKAVLAALVVVIVAVVRQRYLL